MPRFPTPAGWLTIVLCLALSALACGRGEITPPPDSGKTEDPPDDGLGEPDDPVLSYWAYPRIGAAVGQWDRHPSATRAELARFDVIVASDPSPADVAEIQSMNPDATVFYQVMPQVVAVEDWGRPHSLIDRMTRYVRENDWGLKHHNGKPALCRGWGGYWRWADCTSTCPEGTYLDPAEPWLDSTGFTFSEWSSQRLLPWWVDTYGGSYAGMWWEVVAELANHGWWHVDQEGPDGGFLDWDRNGIPDIDEPGTWWAFRDDWEATSRSWINEIRVRIGLDYPIVAGGDQFTHDLTYFHGFKNEDFLVRNTPWNSWWNEFYTWRTPDRPRRGYLFQRDHALSGWDITFNQLWQRDGHADPDSLAQWIRFGLGTTLLGDGIFAYTDVEVYPPASPWISDYFDLELGVAARPFRKQIFGGDTLYVREFLDDEGDVSGIVRVNPNDRTVDGIPARDAVITTDVGGS